MRKIKCAILASTNGTDMQALIDEKGLPAEIKIVVCNKECGAAERARRHGITTVIVLPQGKTRDEFDTEVSQILKKENIDLILLIGYMQILSPAFCIEWNNRIMNVHPSLLPAFIGGMSKDVHQSVIEYGCKVSGCTVHFVTEDVDQGPIIIQKSISMSEDETLETLKWKVQKLEQAALIEAITLFAEDRVVPNGKRVAILDEPMHAVDQTQIVPTSIMNDEEVHQFLADHDMGLTVDEIRLIEEKIQRNPTITELHIFNTEWSEHCSYKSSRELLKTLPTTASNVILGPVEDAGIIELAVVDGDRYGLVIAHESHNHPSQVVPYEGAATGIGGVVRDVLCMGAEVVATADPLRFGNPHGDNKQRVKYIANNVIDGIAGYGNPLGVPVIAGDVYFNSSFNDNCLVNVVCLGVVKEKNIVHSKVPSDSEGFDVILIGKATDNSGFGGAAFASVNLEGELNKGAVQVPDPFLKNMLVRATHHMLEEARNKKVDIGFKDCGAGGIMCVTSELGADGGMGMDITLDGVHQSMDIPPYMIACSETQERFGLVVPTSFTPDVLRIYNEEFALPHVAEGARASVVGKVIKEKRYILRHQGKVVCNLPIDEVTQGIRYTREQKPNGRELQEPQIVEPTDYNEMVLRILRHPHVASKAHAYKHYDTGVQGNTIIRPGEADAGVIAPIPGQPVGVALSVDCNPAYNRIAPWKGAVLAVVESMRNVAAVGATPAALTDCLCNGNPEKPEQFWDFAMNVKGLSDAARGMWQKDTREPVPFVSGNVSFYNESADNSIDPSPIVACVGLLKDYSTAITMKLKERGSELYLIGKRKDECGGSVYYQLHNEVGVQLPSVDFVTARNELYAVIDMISARNVLSCHDISDGGIVSCVAEMMMGGEADGSIGVQLEFTEALRTDKLLFSETGGFILEIKEENKGAVEEVCTKYNIMLQRIGSTILEPRLRIHHGHEKVNLTLAEMKEAWTTGFVEALK